jgi:subtilase family serine protease
MLRGSRITLTVLCCLAPALLPATAAAPAASAAPTRVVRIGSAIALPAGARTLGEVASATELHVTVALQPRDSAALESYAQAVSTPGSSDYGEYLTRAEFARRFGATATAIAAVRDDLRAQGLTPGPTTANDLAIPVTASAGAIEQALSVRLERIALAGHPEAIAASAAPALSATIAPLVQAIVGLNTVGSPQPLALRRNGRSHAAAHESAEKTPRVVTDGPQPCAAATSAASGQSAYTADQLASAYGFSGLYHGGDEGQGQTIALYELEPDNPSDIAAFQSCYGTHASVNYVEVDGGSGTGDGSGEAALDIEDAISLAPKANILVYQAPNSNSNGPGAGPYDDLSAVITQDRAKVVSTSWGQCESEEGASDARAESTLFEEAAAQGQTVVSAAGDDGSEDCYCPPGPECGLGSGSLNTGLAVDDPASQQFVTGVGGTTLSSIGPRPTETAWNNGNNPVSAVVEPGAGGGGLSSLWTMPSYQSDAPASLNVLDKPTGGGCNATRCREVPDVSADADPNDGYLIYYNGDGAESGTEGWQGIGGTSAAAPLWAALFADANAASACGGTDIGFANPGLYRSAATAYSADFNDVTSGNNDFTGSNGGDYAAGAGYDLATGLGTPNAYALTQTICAETLRIASPGAQSTTVHTKVTLRLHAAGGGSTSRSFSARGLPAGLSISKRTGTISGKPRSLGSYSVTVTGRNSAGGLATTSFKWTIGDPPTVSRVSITGVSTGRPRLKLTLTAGRGAPLLSALKLTLPSALALSAKPRISISGKRGFDARRIGGALVMALTRPARSFTITVAYPSLRRKHSVSGRVTLKLTVDDAVLHGTQLKARVRVG